MTPAHHLGTHQEPRKLAAGLHLMFYRVAEDGLIEVIRVLHQRKDVAAHLQG